VREGVNQEQDSFWEREENMFKQKGWMYFFGIILLAGCSSINVNTDFDPSAKFSSLRTFTWYSPSQKQTGDDRIDNPLLDARIRKIVEDQLAMKGYRKSTGATPDFYLNYTLVLNQKTSVQTVDRYYGYAAPAWQYGHGYYGGGPGYIAPETRVYTYNMGTLILDILAAQNQKLIWRGSAEAEVRANRSAEQSSQRITAAVEKMLTKFPPQ